MPKLTQKFLAAEIEVPKSGQIIYRDSLMAGFGLRVTPGSKSYIVEARVNGVVRRITIGKHPALSVSAARAKAKRILSLMASGKDPVLEKANQRKTGVTLQEVLEHYLSVRNVRPNTRRHYTQMLSRCLGDWMELPVAAITKEMVEKRHRELRRTTKQGSSGEAQANGVMRLLGILLNFAAANYEVNGQPIILVNPVRRLSQNHRWYHERRRQTTLPDHKLPAWYQAVNDLRDQKVKDYLLVLLLTGLRRMEAATLRWTDIDLDAKVITVRSEIAKNKREYLLPLTSLLEDVFRSRYQTRIGSDYVFPGRAPSTHMVDSDHAIGNVAQQIGCKLTLHDLRRTFLTTAEKLGLSFVVLKKLANHSGGNDTTFGYVIVDVERLREPMQRITDHFKLMFEGSLKSSGQ